MPDFERRLSQPVQHALQYCDELVLALPGPIEIDRRAFSLDPLIHAFFATPQDIDLMFSRSQPLRDYLSSPRTDDSEFIHAMFAARRREKRTLGVVQEGEIMRRDVEQTLLYFSDHTLTAVSSRPDLTRNYLHQAVFDSLLKNFASQINNVRQEREGLHIERDLALGRINALPNKEPSPHDASSYAEIIAGLDEHIRQITVTLQPKLLVDALAEFLLQPDKALRLTPVEVNVDRKGVITPTQTTSAPRDSLTDILDFPELVGRDRRRHVVMLVRIPREEAEQAIEKIKDEQRRFILI